ncbi:MAG TPA: hypothetical protein VKV03_01380 [Candidatus Binataceae bacterium]|nr:hypothetical protein [Candidatus Binataceae bacterium]
MFSDGTEGLALLFGITLDPEGFVLLPDMELPGLLLVLPEVEPGAPMEELPL